jgi:hypothetical protein
VVWVIATEPKLKLAAKMIASSFFTGLSTFLLADSDAMSSKAWREFGVVVVKMLQDLWVK